MESGTMSARTTMESGTMSAKGHLWPVALVGLLAAGVVTNVAFMVVATRDPSFAVEPDYYRKAVEWDRTMAQEATNAELGWRVAARLEPGVGDTPRILATVRDRDGRPVRGARVSVEAFASVRAGEHTNIGLAPEGDGVYGAALPGARPGLWELRVRVTRGAQVFTQTVEDDLRGR